MKKKNLVRGSLEYAPIVQREDLMNRGDDRLYTLYVVLSGEACCPIAARVYG